MKSAVMLLAAFAIFSGAVHSRADEVQQEGGTYRLKYLYSLDGRTTGHKFKGILGICIDEAAREVYILDGGNKRVVITSAEGIPIYNFRIAQEKDLTIATIAVDRSGRILIGGGNEIAVFDYRGVFKTYLDLTSVPDRGTLLVQSMDVDARNHIFIGSGGFDARIIEVDQDGKFISQIKAEGKFTNVVNLQVGSGFTFLDTGNFRVMQLNESGEVTVKFGVLSSLLGGFSMPSGLALDRSKDRILVVDTNRMKTILFNREGKPLYEFGGPQMFKWPRTLAVDRQGRIYVADGSDNVRVFEVAE